MLVIYRILFIFSLTLGINGSDWSNNYSNINEVETIFMISRILSGISKNYKT